MPRRGRKSNNLRHVKNPNFRRTQNPGGDESSEEEEPADMGVAGPPDMLNEGLDIMADEMEQGEIVSDSGSERAVPVPQENLVDMIRGLKTSQAELQQKITGAIGYQGGRFVRVEKGWAEKTK